MASYAENVSIWWRHHVKSLLINKNSLTWMVGGCAACQSEAGSENPFNTLRPRQNGHRFADHTFKRISLNENVIFSITIPLKFVPKGPINNIPALVQIMAWRRIGDMSLSEPMLTRFTDASLLWRHNEHDSVSNHQPRDGLLDRLFRRRSKKTSKLRVTGLCVGNSPGPVNSPHKSAS